MSHLFQRRRDTVRDEADELKRVLCRLDASDPQTRLAVGAGVQLANAEFIRRFGGIESFLRLPAEEQHGFAERLSDLELGCRGREPGVAMGVGLYRIWLTEMLAGRHEIAEKLGEELTKLSRKCTV